VNVVTAMARLSLVMVALTWTVCASFAGPAEEANAALDRFSAAYTANDVDALVQLYAPNAILLGTNSPIISEGRDAIRAYFTNLKLAGSGNKFKRDER
jgi:ketosteroid isomerase-like protein